MQEQTIPTFSYFQVIEDFDAQSRNGSVCSLSFLPKGRDTDHTSGPGSAIDVDDIDEFILRGDLVHMEGYIDVRPSAIRRTARELGMITQSDADELREALAAEQEHSAALEQDLAETKEALRAMILANAKLIDDAVEDSADAVEDAADAADDAEEDDA